jgi:hypothetical protein
MAECSEEQRIFSDRSNPRSCTILGPQKESVGEPLHVSGSNRKGEGLGWSMRRLWRSGYVTGISGDDIHPCSVLTSVVDPTPPDQVEAAHWLGEVQRCPIRDVTNTEVCAEIAIYSADESSGWGRNFESPLDDCSEAALKVSNLVSG